MEIDKTKVIETLKILGVENGDSVMVQSDLKKFGFYRDKKGRIDLALKPEILYNSLQEIIGDGGTIIVPTFSYSWTNGKIYDRGNSPSTVGTFSEYVRRLKFSIRSKHPLLSICAIGSKADEFASKVDNTSYGRESPFGKMHEYNVKQLMVGVEVCAFKNYVERDIGAASRYSKLFKGRISDQGNKYVDVYEHCVRYLDQDVESVPFLDVICEEDLKQVSTVMLGKSFISVVSSNDVYDIIKRRIQDAPYSTLTKPKDEEAVHLISMLVKEEHNEKEKIKIDRVALNEAGVEKWVWQVQNINLIEKCEITMKEREPFIDYLNDNIEIFINNYPDIGIDERTNGGELEKHFVENRSQVTRDMLTTQNWIIVFPKKRIETVDLNAEYKIKIKLVSEPVSGSAHCNYHYFILPGDLSHNSGPNIAIEIIKDLMSKGGINSDINECNKIKFVSAILKDSPRIGICAQPGLSVADIPLIDQDVEYTESN